MHEQHVSMQGMRGQIHCLDVHPAQPFTCATGASQGCVALWDLRFAAAPSAACLTSEDAGDVLEVRSTAAVDKKVGCCIIPSHLAVRGSYVIIAYR